MKRIAFVAVLVLLLISGVALATDDISRSVIAAGGGHAESGVSTLESTIGQAVIGSFSSGGTELCVGFLAADASGVCRGQPAGGPISSEIYLPVLIKND